MTLYPAFPLYNVACAISSKSSARPCSTLWAHKLRSFLTMFGIAWGVGSLLAAGRAWAKDFRSGNRKQFDSLGENVMFIWGGPRPGGQGSFTGMRQYYLTYQATTRIF